MSSKNNESQEEFLQNRLLSPKEAAAYLGVTRRVLQSILEQGQLKFIPLTPKNWRIRFSDLQEFVYNSISRMTKDKEEVKTNGDREGNTDSQRE